MDDLSQSQYLNLAEQAMRAVENAADAADLDSRRDGSVLNLELDNGEQVIINLQAPVQELWLASKSGAYHFRFTRDAGVIPAKAWVSRSCCFAQ